jgi:hypothetical protein
MYCDYFVVYCFVSLGLAVPWSANCFTFELVRRKNAQIAPIEFSRSASSAKRSDGRTDAKGSKWHARRFDFSIASLSHCSFIAPPSLLHTTSERDDKHRTFIDPDIRL